MAQHRVLIIDLNNFGHYPTLSVGYLTAILRQHDYDVDLLSPLAHGLTGVVREPTPKPWSFIDHYGRYRMANSSSPILRGIYHKVVEYMRSPLARNKETLREAFLAALETPYDAILVSSYLIYYPLCVLIGEICQERDIPLLIGGSYFAQPEVVREWLTIPGVDGIVSGEVELSLPDILTALIHGEDLEAFPGLWTLDGGSFIEPLTDLDAVPFPDYSDFPWHKYENRIVPMMTGRGCRWGVCTFCSDVTSSAGRTFRSRSPENIWGEIEHQSRTHDAELFAFLDLKLNSNLDVWQSLIETFPRQMPDSRWIASVHVGRRQPNGLDAATLKAANRAGLVRINTGLESGSQRLHDLMAKGTELSLSAQFLHDAHDAGISVRTSMILGYPGETAEDLAATVAFIEAHNETLERISLNRFSLLTGTPFHRQLEKSDYHYPQLSNFEANHQQARITFQDEMHSDGAYRHQVWRLLRLVQKINSRPLKTAAQPFLGVI